MWNINIQISLGWSGRGEGGWFDIFIFFYFILFWYFDIFFDFDILIFFDIPLCEDKRRKFRVGSNTMNGRVRNLNTFNTTWKSKLDFSIEIILFLNFECF